MLCPPKNRKIVRQRVLVDPRVLGTLNCPKALPLQLPGERCGCAKLIEVLSCLGIEISPSTTSTLSRQALGPMYSKQREWHDVAPPTETLPTEILQLIVIKV
jgi:hypothetical protein